MFDNGNGNWCILGRVFLCRTWHFCDEQCIFVLTHPFSCRRVECYNQWPSNRSLNQMTPLIMGSKFSLEMFQYEIICFWIPFYGWYSTDYLIFPEGFITAVRNWMQHGISYNVDLRIAVRFPRRECTGRPCSDQRYDDSGFDGPRIHQWYVSFAKGDSVPSRKRLHWFFLFDGMVGSFHHCIILLKPLQRFDCSREIWSTCLNNT